MKSNVVLDVQVLSLHITEDPGKQRVKLVYGKRTVDFAPPDIIFAGRLLDNEFIVGGAACVLSSIDHYRPEMGYRPFRIFYDLLVKLGGRKIPVNIFRIPDAMSFQTYFML